MVENLQKIEENVKMMEMDYCVERNVGEIMEYFLKARYFNLLNIFWRFK